MQADFGLTSATILDGFTIDSGGEYTAGSVATAAMTIQNHAIPGGSGTIRAYGMFAKGAAAIRTNTRSGGVDPGISNSSYGIYLYSSNALIEANDVSSGDTGSMGYGLGRSRGRYENGTDSDLGRVTNNDT